MTDPDDISHSRALALHSQLPEFTPVPRKRMRRGGWSPERQQEFIERLAETGSVRAACRAMGVNDTTIYRLRRHPEADSFRKAWEAALDIGIAKIEDVAMDRAMNGVEVPVYHRGKLVGSRRVYNDRLLMFLLRNRAPERFAVDAARRPNAIGQNEMKRMKKQWRKEWEAEEYGPENEQEVLDNIDVIIDQMKDEYAAHLQADHIQMSPRTIAAKEKYERLRAVDEAEGYDCTRDPAHPLCAAPAKRGGNNAALTRPPFTKEPD